MKKLLLIAFMWFGLGQIASADTSAIPGTKHTYDSKEYRLLIDVKKFYKFTRLAKSSTKVEMENKSTLVEMKINGYECLMNNVKFILTNPVVLINGHPAISSMDLIKLFEPVLRPSYIKDAGLFRTVIIDPGHGGKDPGAVNRYGTEADYNLKVALRVRSYLKKSGFNVVMTRTADTSLSLSDRVKLANSHRDAIFISIHFNAGGAGKAHGIETFVLSPQGVAHQGRNVRQSDYAKLKGNYQDSQNIALATAVHGSAKPLLGVADRGIKRARYNVLTGITIPAILVEGGFMSNPTEALKIHKASYQEALAQGIKTGVMRYKKALSR